MTSSARASTCARAILFVALSAAAALVAGAALADGGPTQPAPVVHARATVASLELDGVALQGALRSARATRDGERALCLDDALTRMHVATRAARGMSDAIAAASSTGDGLTTTRETTRLDHLGERARVLFRTAQHCGSLDSPFGGSDRTVVTVVAPRLPTADAYPTPVGQ